MGWRALRLSLTRSALMKAQARALIEAADGRVLRVMFPMVSEPWEYEEARSLVRGAARMVARPSAARCPSRIEFGAMLEVPSLAEMLDVLLPRIDFLSIGTNDLTQFLFAADRADPRLAERYDWLSPAILRFLRRDRRRRRRRRRPGAAVRRDGRAAAGGDGADRHRHRSNFSITPAAVGPVKAMVRSLDARRGRGQDGDAAGQAAARHAHAR